MQGCSNDSWRNQHVKSVNTVNTSLCVSCVKRSSAAQTTEFRLFADAGMKLFGCVMSSNKTENRQKSDIYHPHTRWLCSTLCHSSMQNDCVLRRGLPLYPKINSNTVWSIFLDMNCCCSETDEKPQHHHHPTKRHWTDHCFLHFSKSFSVRS